MREVREELGVVIRAQDLALATSMQRTDGTAEAVHQRVDWFFTAGAWEGTPRIMEPRKCAAIGWFDLDSLPVPLPAYEEIVLRGMSSNALSGFTSHGF